MADNKPKKKGDSFDRVACPNQPNNHHNNPKQTILHISKSATRDLGSRPLILGISFSHNFEHVRGVDDYFGAVTKKDDFACYLDFFALYLV